MKTLLAALLVTAGTLVAGPQNKCPDPAVTDVRATQIKASKTLTRYQFVVEVTNVGGETFKAASGSVVTLQFSPGGKARRTMASQPLPSLTPGEVTTLTFEANVDNDRRLPEWDAMPFPAEICGAIVVKLAPGATPECDATNNRLCKAP